MENESHHSGGGSGGSKTSHLPGLEGFFDTYLHLRSPIQLPAGAKEFIVKYGPWISLVLLIIAAVTVIPLMIFALGLTAATLPFQAAVGVIHTTTLWYVHLVISFVVLVMEGIAIPGLLKRKMSGWRMLYYAMLLSAVGNLLAQDILGFIFGLVISMFILFQIREYYR
jgi:hypothetical protein